MVEYRLLLIGLFIVTSLLPSKVLSHDYCTYENSLDSDYIYVNNHSEYGSDCTPIDIKTAAAVLGGLVLLVLIIPDPPIEESNDQVALKAFSSDNYFGLEYTEIPENLFIQFVVPKNDVSQPKHLHKVNQDNFNFSGPMLKFGLRF